MAELENRSPRPWRGLHQRKIRKYIDPVRSYSTSGKFLKVSKAWNCFASRCLSCALTELERRKGESHV
jgi:hypothetical protein